jgi:hypothetical protein
VEVEWGFGCSGELAVTFEPMGIVAWHMKPVKWADNIGLSGQFSTFSISPQLFVLDFRSHGI